MPLVVKVLQAHKEVLVHVVQLALLATRDNLGLLDSKDHQDLQVQRDLLETLAILVHLDHLDQ